MIISRTPYRISFFGGGTDYPSWYRRHGGAVLGTTIDKYCYLTCRHLPPFFEHRTRVVYSKIENVKHIDEITHPAVREVLRHLGITRGVEIHHDGDLPARSGVGSSSAFTVGLTNALHALEGRMRTKQQLAAEAIHIEQRILAENVGCQDQIFAAYGGLNHVAFTPDGATAVRPVTLPRDRQQALADHLMLFFTGVQRTASDIAGTYALETARNERRLASIASLVDDAMGVLASDGGLDDFGALLHETWTMKRSLSTAVSNPEIDEIYAAARDAGAIGGKILGAGGGGFMLLFVRPEMRGLVVQRLHRLIHVPFRFESAGSQIIFFESEEDFAEQDRQRRQAMDGLSAASTALSGNGPSIIS